MIVIRILAFCLAATGMCVGQDTATVRWQFSAQPVSPHEHLLVLKASVMPGWHLYSQHLPEGGPAPTRIYFDASEAYQLKDSTIEKGEAVTFYDRTYEMEITWYTGSVSFMQRVLADHRPLIIRGHIEYMTCNTEVCQVFRQPFAITLRN
jgi:hypothetical protein